MAWRGRLSGGRSTTTPIRECNRLNAVDRDRASLSINSRNDRRRKVMARHASLHIAQPERRKALDVIDFKTRPWFPPGNTVVNQVCNVPCVAWARQGVQWRLLRVGEAYHFTSIKLWVQFYDPCFRTGSRTSIHYYKQINSNVIWCLFIATII